MIIDARGKPCPTPVVMTKKYLDSINEGAFTVLLDSEVSKNNVVKFLESQAVIYNVKTDKNGFTIDVVKGYTCNTKNESTENQKNNIVLFLTAETIGHENAELGKILMKGFLSNLKEQPRLPNTIILVNTAVLLSTKNLDTIPPLKELEDLGIEILSCGTCLNFLQIKPEDLKVGSITDAYTVTKKLLEADKTIRL
ncbi:MAG: sulfurtransferase-like selenium metabolism protein YedF [Calditerrivibrio sp.]|nr:sulfurtransferase-like selenium metabolism protein YedF [Calditerrivibrio sp.]